MKHITLLAATLLLGLSAGAQTIEATSFESWTGNLPDGWVGSKTSLETDSIEQVTTGVQFGSSAVRLINEQSAHRRFTTQGLSVDSGETYTVQFYARGAGSIRTGLFDGRSASSGYSAYNPYVTVTNTWTMYAQQLVCAHDSSGAEFILSVQLTEAPDHVEVDSVRIYVGAGAPAPFASIYDIQFTTNPNGDSPLVGQQVSTGGIVTAWDTTGYWIQNDAGAYRGLYVFDSANIPSVGDSIEIIGSVIEYQGLTELSSVTGFNVVSSGNAVVSTTISTADANTEAYEGQLVTVVGAQCINPNSGFGQWIVNDGSGDVFVNDEMYPFTPTIGVYYDVTGPLSYAFSERKIEPRDMNDISISSTVTERFGDVVNVYPNPASDVLFVSFTNGPERTDYTLTDLTGRTVLGGLLTSDLQAIDLGGVASGNYVLTLRTAQRLLSGRVQVTR